MIIGVGRSAARTTTRVPGSACRTSGCEWTVDQEYRRPVLAAALPPSGEVSGKLILVAGQKMSGNFKLYPWKKTFSEKVREFQILLGNVFKIPKF